ncbi:MAG: sigma-70 family RNA polymerase sigma factor [Bacteroidota bacterium]
MNQLQQRRLQEQELVSLLRNRDKQGVRLLYQNYSGSLFGIISRIIQQQEIAEEVLQDVFLKIWDNIEKYDPNKGRLYTWLVQLTRNLALDRVRSASFRKNARVDGLEAATTTLTQLGELTYTEDSGLRAVIASLDEKYRTLIDYAYYQGYSQSEISEELSIPLGTVKTRMRTAISQLRLLLQDEMTTFLILLSCIQI